MKPCSATHRRTDHLRFNQMPTSENSAVYAPGMVATSTVNPWANPSQANWVGGWLF